MKNIQLIHACIIPLCLITSGTFAASGHPSSHINTQIDNHYSKQRILLAGSKGSGRIGRSGGNFSRGRISSSRGGHVGRYNTRRFYGGYGGLGGGYGFYSSRFYGPGFYDGFYGYGGYGGYGYHRYNHGAYYPPAVVIPSTPPVYIEKEPEQPVQSTQTNQESNHWHYCRKPEGYYPYVRKCEGGWLKVAPHPAQ